MNDISSSSTQSSTKSPQSPDASEPRDDAALALASGVAAGAHELGDQAKHVAGDVMAQAKRAAQSRISGGKERAAQSLGQVADALRLTGERLEHDKSGLTDYVVRIADKVEAASGYLQRRNVRDVIDDVGGFARREPALFLGGAFAVGLLGGRFLKSSRSMTTRQDAGDGGNGAGGA